VRLIGALSVVALVVAASLLAVAWREGPADFHCGGLSDRHGDPLPAEEWRERRDSYGDRSGLLFGAFVTAGAGGAISLVGILVLAARRVWSRTTLAFGALLAAAALLVAASFFSLPALVPCLGY
jgi:hypothetical protein